MLAAIALLTVSAPFRLHFDNGEFAQVVFNVTCLGGRVACSKPLIEKFWRQELHWTGEDQRQLDAWRETLGAIGGREPKAESVPFLPNYPGYYPELVVVNRLVAAGLDSRSPAEFRRKASGIARPDEVAKLTALLRHFEHRMRPWFGANGARYLAARGKAIEAGMRDPRFAALAAKISRFMESELATRDFYVHLIARGDHESDSATATFVRNHVVLELTDTMKPEAAQTIIMHEMTHALYDLAPRARHQQLIRDFAAAGEPRALSYYTLLNEGLATGLQLMLLRQASQNDEDAYRHPYIPRIGRAASPLIERTLQDEKATLFNGFVEPYLRAGAAEMKAEAGSPKFVLSSVALTKIGDADLSAASQAFDAEMATIGRVGFADREQFPAINLAMLVTYTDLDKIISTWPEMTQLAKENRAFAYVAPRGSKGRSFIFAGRDGAAVAEIVRALAAAPSMPERGVVVKLPLTASPPPPAR